MLRGGFILNKIPDSIACAVDEICSKLNHRPILKKLFKNCFTNTLETTPELLEDGTTYVFTGDIPALWLRDSSAQVRHYIPFAKEDSEVQRIIEGLIKRQIMYILIDPYANAFNREANGQCYHKDVTDTNDWIWERKYEIDSLCYPIQLSYLYWKATDKTEIFDEKFKGAMQTIMDLWKTEQRHHEESPYSFLRLQEGSPEHGQLYNGGRGMPVNYTGMTWSGFRPSDDACTFGYLIPSNMFAVTVLRYMEEIAETVYKDDELKNSASILGKEIDYGIRTYGIYHHPRWGRIYAYETDGFGNYNLMDDANVPSLLSAPYLGYTTTQDPIYQNTRRFILSKDNPYYYEGKYARGIGSPHTPENYIWHISLAMQGLTSEDRDETEAIINLFETTHGGTYYMHEGFDVDNPDNFTRHWFAWANSLFGEFIYKVVTETDILSDGSVK